MSDRRLRGDRSRAPGRDRRACRGASVPQRPGRAIRLRGPASGARCRHPPIRYRRGTKRRREPQSGRTQEMTIALPASTFRSSRSQWIVLVPALASVACGVAIMVSPDATTLVRTLGAAVSGISLLTAISSYRAAAIEIDPPRLPVRAIETTAKETTANETGLGTQSTV